MSVATHVIKIKGEFDLGKWNEEKLKELVRTKIKKEIDKFYCTDLELFRIEEKEGNGIIDVWVFIEFVGADISTVKTNAEKWLKDHIIEKEEGITIKDFEVKDVPYKDGIRVILNDFALENL